MKFRQAVLVLGVAMLFLFTTTVFAFTDADKKGDDKLTYGEAVSLIVQAFDLHIDQLRFIHEPKASDYFQNVPDDAPYADAFVIAHLNGLPLNEDVKPDSFITKEAFAHLLFHAILAKGEFAFIEMWVNIKDEHAINPQYMESIQKLLVSHIMTLDHGLFHPHKLVSYDEAQALIDKALDFVNRVS